MACIFVVHWVTVGYHVEDIGVLSGDPDSRGFDVNSLTFREQVAGSSDTHAVIWEHVFQPPTATILIDLEDYTGSQAPISIAMGLNNLFPSWVVGYHSYTDINQPIPMLWQKYGPTELPTLADASDAQGTGWARSVNDIGQIVGWSTDAQGTKLATLWTSPIGVWQAQSLGTLGGPTSEAYKINQKGTIVGAADIAQGKSHACRWRLGNPIEDIHSGPGTSAALGVNMFDEVVGDAIPAGADQAFVWTWGPGFQILPGLPGSASSFATSINHPGEIVGRSDLNGPNAVLWHTLNVAPVKLTDQILNAPGWNLERAESINDHGQICGYGKNPNGTSTGFLLSPVKMPIWQVKCPAPPGPWPTWGPAKPPVPHKPPVNEFPPWPPPGILQSNIQSTVHIDGGKFLRTPNGQIIHASSLRPNPNPMIVNPLTYNTLLGAISGGTSERDREVGKKLAALLPGIMEHGWSQILRELAVRDAVRDKNGKKSQQN